MDRIEAWTTFAAVAEAGSPAAAARTDWLRVAPIRNDDAVIERALAGDAVAVDATARTFHC